MSQATSSGPLLLLLLAAIDVRYAGGCVQRSARRSPNGTEMRTAFEKLDGGASRNENVPSKKQIDFAKSKFARTYLHCLFLEDAQYIKIHLD